MRIHSTAPGHQRAPHPRDLAHRRPRRGTNWQPPTQTNPVVRRRGALCPSEVEVGWHLHPDAWGNGYATEAATAAVTDAFARGLERVIAVTHLDNHASQAVCRRLDMRHLGLTNRYMDTTCNLYELTP